ncbi:hypothetical protein Ancab_012407 [Ancistrocladus abbreviatus]
MYSGSHKFGRGGGAGGRGGGGKRNVFSVPPPHRPSSSGGGRLSLGGSAPRSRNPSVSAQSSGAAQVAVEETFSLLPGNPLSFAAIIRLAPDLVDEIKRVEAQGGAARIKFDSNPNNSSGNVIDVGGKEFRFTWSGETGGLCDIYEERQGSEDGNGLLVESGCPWRKLNVQRVLDESTKNHVKMRSEEAERKHKSRKAIVLEPGNPSMKSQAKALAAVEVSPWKAFKQKKEPPFKKHKVEPPQASAPPKGVHKSGIPSVTVKGKLSTSPLPSPPNQSMSTASPSAINGNKSQAIAEDAMPVPITAKESVFSSERELPNQAFGGVQETTGYKGNQAAMPTDLQNVLVALLKEKPNGMSLKALEKAVVDPFPNSARMIEPILKKIATFQAPGRYLLKPGVELERLKKSFSESGSSPEDNHHKMPVPEENHSAASAPLDVAFTEKSPAEDLEEQMPLDSSKYGEQAKLVEKIDMPQHSQDPFGDKKGFDNSVGQPGSSSDSGSDSDSDSDSSDSGSDSGSQSRSRSRSPMESGSGSSSDSDSDSSSNSKEGSDIDVNIMTSDDEKEMKHSGIAEKEDGHGSEAVEIGKDLSGDNEGADVDLSPNTDSKSVGKIEPSSLYHEKHQVHQNIDVVNNRDNIVTDGFGHEQLDSSERSKGNSKGGADVMHLEENSEHVKCSKTGNSAPYIISEHQGSHGPAFAGSPERSSPDGLNDDHYDGRNIQMPNRYDRNDNMESGLQRGYGYAGPGKSIVEQQQSGRRASLWSHDPEVVDKSGKHADSWEQGMRHPERSVNTNEGLSKHENILHRQKQDEEGNSNEKTNRKFKDSSHGKKHLRQESHYRKHNEQVKKFRTEEHFSNSHIECSLKASDRAGVSRSPVVNGKGGMLQRELSDLELGELREPMPDEPEGDKTDFEKKGSFKHSETNEGHSDYWNPDLGKGRPFNKPALDTGKPSSPNIRSGIPRNSEGSSKRRSEDPYIEDPLRPNRAVQSNLRQSMVEVRSLSNKAADIRQEAAESQQTDMEGYGETHKKPHVRTQHQDLTQELPSNSVKGNKSLKSSSLTEAIDRRRDLSSNEARNGDRKRSESSSNENSSYSKYEKEEPELKGPIKDFLQYKEYVQEYQEKYDSYLSLNKILEGYRDEFEKYGRDLESAKVHKDMERYHNIVAQLRASYRQCASRHKRLKKVFVVLHKELKNLKQRIKVFAEPYLKD